MRFSKIEKHPGLKPFAGTWKVGVVSLIIYLITSSILDSELVKPFGDWLSSLEWNVVFLMIPLFFFNLIVIVNYAFEKKRDKFTTIFSIISFAFLILFIYLLSQDPNNS